MTPTMKLRLVKRGFKNTIPAMFMQIGGKNPQEPILVLQQWWQGSSMGTINLGFGGDMPLGAVKGEWRDVPIEDE